MKVLKTPMKWFCDYVSHRGLRKPLSRTKGRAQVNNLKNGCHVFASYQFLMISMDILPVNCSFGVRDAEFRVVVIGPGLRSLNKRS